MLELDVHIRAARQNRMQHFVAAETYVRYQLFRLSTCNTFILVDWYIRIEHNIVGNLLQHN